MKFVWIFDYSKPIDNISNHHSQNFSRICSCHGTACHPYANRFGCWKMRRDIKTICCDSVQLLYSIHKGNHDVPYIRATLSWSCRLWQELQQLSTDRICICVFISRVLSSLSRKFDMQASRRHLVIGEINLNTSSELYENALKQYLMMAFCTSSWKVLYHHALEIGCLFQTYFDWPGPVLTTDQSGLESIIKKTQRRHQECFKSEP